MSKQDFVSIRVCVIIPTFNNAGTLASIIDELLASGAPVIVVNDGSTDATGSILNGYGGRVETISYHPNRGKGYALRRGFHRARERGFSYALTIDADGQHFVDDIPVFLDALGSHPGALLVGARQMQNETVPKKNRFGHLLSNISFKIIAGISLPDTQSGYRLYPLVPLDGMTFYTYRYEFEIEVLVLCAWKGVPIISVPVKVRYLPKDTRVSHFRPFTDFMRVSVLNAALFAVAVLFVWPVFWIKKIGRKKDAFLLIIRESLDSPRKIAAAVALGVFCGIIPVWGFQALLALLLATLFRVNRLLAFAATNISIPPLIPVIVVASIKMGGWITHRSALPQQVSSGIVHSIPSYLLQYLVGSVGLALVCAFFAGGVTYIITVLLFRKKT